VPFRLPRGEKTLRLHVFLDRSVLEVYANDRACVTRVVHPQTEDLKLEVLAGRGQAVLKSLRAWPVRTIWQ
jgi:beta-fructofuranosidase